MENLNYIAFVMPAFFLFLFLEYKVAQLNKRKEFFKYESSISNITIGIAERLLNLFVSFSFYQLYFWIYNNYKLFEIPNNWFIWIVLILTTDLVWYWYHRLGHEVNIFWAAHIVHHQSEEFNFTVSARITTIQAVIRTGFWCILPFIGFHPTMVIAMLLIHGAYSFFTHTQLVGKIKWLEYVFITPSLHGIHHASDEKYLDKNYGDMFVFWDKMFGTFQAEEEKPKYGLTHPLKSYSFLWQHFHYFFEIYESCKRSNSFKEKWKAIFGSPALMDQDIRPELEKRFLQDRSLKLKELRFKGYLTFQIALSIILLTWFTYFFDNQDLPDKLFYTVFILITLVNCGALLEQRNWIYYLEYARLYTLCIYWLHIEGYVDFFWLPAAIMIAVEKIFSLSRWYQSFVLQTK